MTEWFVCLFVGFFLLYSQVYANLAIASQFTAFHITYKGKVIKKKTIWN
jgi:hypothetical protein